MSDCIFCRIRDKQIPSSIVFENDSVLAFRDIHPQAPVHIVFITKEHIPSLKHLGPADQALLTAVFAAINQVAAELGVAESGFRVISNCGKAAGQTVEHLHFHLLGGKVLD